MGSATTVAPAARAISAVRSVELLSQTISSVSHPRCQNCALAAWTRARVSPMSRCSLKAGIMMEILKRSTPELPQHFSPSAPGRFQAILFHSVIECGHFTARLRQIRAAALFAAALGLHQSLLETALHRLDQRPGAHIGHAHALGRSDDRTSFPDMVQQLHLPRPKRNVAPAHDAQPWLKCAPLRFSTLSHKSNQ